MKKTLLILMSILWLSGCATTPAEPIPPVKKDPIQKVSMTFTGDLLWEQPLYDDMEDYEFNTYFNKIKPYLTGDFIVGNQEVPIGGEELGVSGVAYTFNAPKKIADQYLDLGINIMSLANNHSFDMGNQGITNTLKNLHDNRIRTYGLVDDEQDDTTLYIEKNGVKIALLAYTYDTNTPLPAEDRYKVPCFLDDNYQFSAEKQAEMKQDIIEANKNADATIVSMHWGREFSYELQDVQQVVSTFLNELEVDVIIGNHPHTLQTMDLLTNEQGHTTTVFYSLGNFVAAAANVDRANEAFTNMYQIGGIVSFDIEKNTETKQTSIQNLKLVPLINHFEYPYTNFAILPFKDYNEELATKHYQRYYSNDFRYDWLKQEILSLFEGKIDILM